MGVFPQPRQSSKVKVGVVGHNHRAANAGQGLKSRRDNDAPGPALDQLLLILGMAQKGDVLALCGLERCQTFDSELR